MQVPKLDMATITETAASERIKERSAGVVKQPARLLAVSLLKAASP